MDLQRHQTIALYLSFYTFSYIDTVALYIFEGQLRWASVTHLDCFHWADHQNSLHDPGSKPTQQAFGAVQSTGLILGVVTEELKHPKPNK